MKNTVLILLLLLSCCSAVAQQDVRGKRGIFDNGLYLSGRWIDAVKNDTANIQTNKDRTILTTKATLDLLTNISLESAPFLNAFNFSTFPVTQRKIDVNGVEIIGDIVDPRTGGYFMVRKMPFYKTIAITDAFLDSTVFFKRGSDYYVRVFDKLTVEMFGAKPDFSTTTGIGTDNTYYFQKAINTLVRLGGGDLILPTGKWLVDSTVYVNSEAQVPINLIGEGYNASYSEGDTALKGTVIFRTKPGAIFKTNLNQNNRYFYQASFTYKSFGANNLTFYGMNGQAGIRCFEMFRTRMKGSNLTAYKTDYLIYQPDTDGFGNDSYCDQNHLRNIKIYASRLSGIKWYKNDAGSIDDLTMEVGTSTTIHLLEMKAGSSTSVKSVVMGNAGTGQLISGSSVFLIENCTNPFFGELHLERNYMEYHFDVKSNTRGLKVDGYYPKFTMNGGFNFSFDVRNTEVKHVFALATPAIGYYDFNSNSGNIDGLNIDFDDWRDADQNVRARTMNGTFNSSTTASLNNMLTSERYNYGKAVNELKRMLNYQQAQKVLSGGGTITYSSDSALKWTSQFFVSLIDRNVTTSTFLRRFPPAAGDTIFGLGSTPYVIVDGNGFIKIANDNALIMVHSTGLNADSNKLYIVNRANLSANQWPQNSIIIATKFKDDGSINLGTGHVLAPGDIVVENRKLDRAIQQSASNINATVNSRTNILILSESSNNTGTRTITLKDPVAFKETYLKIINYNNSANLFALSSAIKDYSNSDVTSLENRTTYELWSNGTHWKILEKYSNVTAGGGGTNNNGTPSVTWD